MQRFVNMLLATQVPQAVASFYKYSQEDSNDKSRHAFSYEALLLCYNKIWMSTNPYVSNIDKHNAKNFHRGN